MITPSRCQTITTKYLAPTNNRRARVKATSTSGISVTVAWDHSNDDAGNHTRAAEALIAKLGWTGDWAGGVLKGGRCHCFVAVPTAKPTGDSYYTKELTRVEGTYAKVKVTSDKGESKWLNLNPDSAAAIRAFLASRGF